MLKCQELKLREYLESTDARCTVEVIEKGKVKIRDKKDRILRSNIDLDAIVDAYGWDWHKKEVYFALKEV